MDESCLDDDGGRLALVHALAHANHERKRPVAAHCAVCGWARGRRRHGAARSGAEAGTHSCRPSFRISSSLPLGVAALKAASECTRSAGIATWYLDTEPDVLLNEIRAVSRRMKEVASTVRSTFVFTIPLFTLAPAAALATNAAATAAKRRCSVMSTGSRGE